MEARVRGGHLHGLPRQSRGPRLRAHGGGAREHLLRRGPRGGPTLAADTFAAYLELGYAPYNGYAERIVDVKMPSFITRTRLSLKPTLVGMGMDDLFCGSTPRPDFSGLWGGVTCVDEVYHEVYIDVNLKGTEAAAATAVVMNNVNNVGGPEYFFFHADRPFLYAIVDRATKVPLFIGQLVN
ncbi:MAG: hypothetical protein CVU65_18860 [Deltaproteobacteria bacterium HGW-Deltaproteobacteria-22]|nr:MAG: hypothetical protein CVU65_18860 [Deltaproteobacteria bacterium HGW-Deltaproteobacteria-22]